MKFGVPWSVKGIRPEARETAKEAARQSGMSLGDWLNSVILQQTAQGGPQPQPYGYADEDAYGDELAGVNQRLDDLTRRIEQFTRKGPEAYAPKHHRAEPDQIADLIGRLDTRLEQFATMAHPAAPPLAPAAAPRAQPQLYPNVQLPPSLDRAVAEIAARQRALNGAAPPAARQSYREPRAAAPVSAPMAAPMAMAAPLPAQDISGLEEQLRKITDQIETLRKPGVEEAINALRGELGEIGRALSDAMPKRAIDTLEQQIQGLSQRVAEGRHAGVDANALSGIEYGLGEVRDALRGLTPAENLVGFNEAVAGLAQKIDLIVAEKDPATLHQLESAITTLRSMAGNVASNDAVARLAGEVEKLADKVEQIGSGSGSDVLHHLESRIDALSRALTERAQNGNTVPPRLEALVQSLSDKIEQVQEVQQLQQSQGDNVAVSHLEDRIVNLVEKLDASEGRLGHLEAIERGLADLLVHIDDIRTTRQPAAARVEASPTVDELKVDIARTHDSIDAVHGTLGMLMDRLATLEKNMHGDRRAAPVPPAWEEDVDLRQPVGRLGVRLVDDAPPSAPEPPRQAFQPPPPPPVAAPMRAPVQERSPEPVQGWDQEIDQGDVQENVQWSAPEEERPVFGRAPEPAPAKLPLAAPFTVQAAPVTPPPQPQPAPQPSAMRMPAAERPPIDPDLPEDEPLEPGTGRPLGHDNPSSRIAASEAALGGARSGGSGAAGQSSFIAAARRAAQAALQQEPVAPRPYEAADDLDDAPESDGRSIRAKMMKRMKSLFVAASIVAIVVGSAHIVGTVLDLGGGDKTAKQSPQQSEPRQAVAPQAVAPQAAVPIVQTVAPPMTPMTPPGFNLLAPPPSTIAIGALPQPDPRQAAQVATNEAAEPAPDDVTGSIARNGASRLPPGIGSQALRSAALAGNAAAAYEVGLRFAEGRGVPVNLDEAARWYERAAAKGLVPAQFRYGSMLEKGQGVKKDLGHARRLYLAAAAQGNAKAMHNLAVLYAEGIDGRPDYGTASKWFLKAAKHGVSDSQYNLGILYGRGIGVTKDEVESYKWFALAATSGDRESAKKRDEIGSHLEPEEIEAARQAVAQFKAEPQPDVATTVSVPPGGWDKTGAAPAPPAPRGQPRTSGPLVIGKR